MGNPTEKNERLTTIVCALVAIAMIAAGVTARQGDSPASNEPEQWESDVRYQIKASFRQRARERDARLSQVEAVMAAWRTSNQSEADREKLIEWLSDTIVRSMPGSIDDLTPQPTFSSHESAAVVYSPPAELPRPPATIQAPSLLAGTRFPDVPITPTPYDPFSVKIANDGAMEVEEPIAPTPDDSFVPEQPPTVDPSKRHLANKPGIETAALPQAPLPGSSMVSFETRDQVDKSEKQPLTVVSPHPVQVAINLTELAARIAGYHDSLDEVETALLRTDEASLELVAEQAQKLDTMTRDYNFVRLYYESLSDDERQTLLAPRPLSATLKEVSRQLDRYELSLDTDFLGSIDSSQAEQIAELRGLLAALGERIGR
ncbi:hypothetical protein [Bythopirellula goksoeyrii]|uniref:Uncharacterized protein n=1 Tax=Bythopirellula goksoeyrii TaxID=1400387 RepID=A0A5B9Q4L2_9BACT|nr:hypothetical protein [Bythopirellula goksoeyrii]QEG33964.1 hypothetical protein Pr1d_12350 [Bythopirellula goksoeyrii]